MNAISSLVFAAMVVFFAIAVCNVRSAPDYEQIRKDTITIQDQVTDIVSQSINIISAANSSYFAIVKDSLIATYTLKMITDINKIVKAGVNIYQQLNVTSKYQG